jgi:ABC-type methionine transport system ATPase subunit
LAREIYSSAQVLLLDDVLSALDVHTSRWVVNKCLAGDLLKGRTVILVTHNILLSGPIADYMVVLNLDGTLRSHGPVEKLLKGDKELRTVAAQDLEFEETKELSEEQAEEQKAQLTKGKQIVEEELAIGHVGWPVCAYSYF